MLKKFSLYKLLKWCVCAAFLSVFLPAYAASVRLGTIPSGKTLLFAGQAVEPSIYGSMEDYVSQVGTTPAGFSFYLILSGDLQRTRNELATIQSFVDRYPNAAVHMAIGYGPHLTLNDYYSKRLLGGAFDAELRSVGEWVQAQARPVFVRPLYEFDRACHTYGNPDLYKRAYRYIVDSIHRTGAGSNMSIVWHSAGPGFRLDVYTPSKVIDPCPIAKFYPGKEYVDYFSISYWGNGSSIGRNLNPAVTGENYQKEVARLFDEATKLGLPLMISESTPAWIGTTSGAESVQWVNQYFDLIERFDIKSVSYINAAWGAEGGVWGVMGFFPKEARLHVDPEVLNTWKKRTASKRYVNAAELNSTIGYVPYPARLPWAGTAMPKRDKLTWPKCPKGSLIGLGGWCLPPLR